MNERLKTLLADLDRGETLAGPDWRRYLKRAAWLAESPPDERCELLQALLARTQPLAERADLLLAEALRLVVKDERTKEPKNQRTKDPPEGHDTLLSTLYSKLEKSSPSRAWLLAWLAGGDERQLQALGELLVADPPTTDQDVVQALAPLFQRRDGAPAALFPRLLDALAHPQLAAPVLDLANFLAREKLVAAHPAADRAGQLCELLGGLTQSLARLEENPEASGLGPLDLSRQVAHSVALAVSLCDALAQIGDQAAIGKLNQNLELRHRRLRTEAAAALAQLGAKNGAEELVALAAEPVARLRVLAYAEELGLLGKIDPEWQTPQARAEAALTVWLAEPTQFGVPPSTMELFDQRRQHWPGFDDPVDCYLFRFAYTVTVEGEGERSFSNIGIAGPLTHAFVADLGDLPHDDIYAAYAGWQAEHTEIQEFEVSRLSRSEQLEVERLARRLHDAGFTGIEPVFMGYFFGTKVLVGKALRGGVSGIAIVDQSDEIFFPHGRSPRPLGARECYCIYKGRRLLASFNPSLRGAPGGG